MKSLIANCLGFDTVCLANLKVPASTPPLRALESHLQMIKNIWFGKILMGPFDSQIELFSNVQSSHSYKEPFVVFSDFFREKGIKKENIWRMPLAQTYFSPVKLILKLCCKLFYFISHCFCCSVDWNSPFLL